jgi:hypothetical protein
MNTLVMKFGGNMLGTESGVRQEKARREEHNQQDTTPLARYQNVHRNEK